MMALLSRVVCKMWCWWLVADTYNNNSPSISFIFFFFFLMGFTCLPALRRLSSFTRRDHLMRSMARSSLPACLMFIIYTLLSPSSPLDSVLSFLSTSTTTKSNPGRNGRWKSFHCSYYKNPKALPSSPIWVDFNMNHTRRLNEIFLEFVSKYLAQSDSTIKNDMTNHNKNRMN